MLKTTFKILALFVLLTVVGVATGLTTYTVTRRMLEEQNASAKVSETVETRNDDAVSVGSDAEPKGNTSDTGFEYYLVRLEGDELNIYVSHNGKEEFLYNRDIYKTDLSNQDRLMLEEGVQLRSPSALTGFIENFTS